MTTVIQAVGDDSDGDGEKWLDYFENKGSGFC